MLQALCEYNPQVIRRGSFTACSFLSSNPIFLAFVLLLVLALVSYPFS